MKESLGNILFLLILALAAAGLWVWSYGLAPGPGGAAVTVVVPPGASFTAIEKKLVRAGLVRPDVRFRLTAMLMGLSRGLKAGDYRLDPAASPAAILEELARGSARPRALTIPEGYNLRQIDRLMAKEGWSAPGEVLRLAHDPAFIAELGLAASSLEGYLFPDTYFFVRGGEGLREMLATMVAQCRKVMAELRVAKRLEGRGLDEHGFLTLASIVEKESGRADEQPLIARVFLNRLARGMRLQADPTVIYGIKDFNGNLTRRDLATPGPYNTYLNKGLPPGPICNPGRSAMRAVLEPARGKYLYFVAKNDGTHCFSTTLAAHNRAVARYQKHGRRKKR